MMKKNILVRTNILICAVIIAGFILTAALSYRANYSASIESIEQVSTLTSEGIYYQINRTFTKPVNISLTMANDSLLKELLSAESGSLADKQYTEKIQNYLSTYQEKYDYESVFLVSRESGRYYTYKGLDRVLKEGDAENDWYFQMLDSKEDYSMNVDNDEVIGAENEITVFVNCKIKNDRGEILGIVGVGMRIGHLQELLQGYQDEFGVNAYLVNDDGTIEISTDYTGFEGVSLFEEKKYAKDVKEKMTEWKREESADSFWSKASGTGEKKEFIVTRYLPELQWHLVVERDAGEMVKKLNRQLGLTVAVIVVIILVILLIITRVIHSFNKRIISLTQSVEQGRRTMFEKATEQLFDKIYELDITNNCPANKATEDYFEELGAPYGTPYDKALRIVAGKQIKEEFREGYIETFKPENVLKAHAEGHDTLRYEFMILNENQDYYWMRITARIVPWEGDGSIHMLTYRQNIDAEMRQEQRLQVLAQTDEMTGLLTKGATERQIKRRIMEEPGRSHALFLFDIDRFKEANDIHGHAFGDSVIKTFAKTIRQHFRKDDLIGRIGGDEFAAFITVSDEEWVREKAAELLKALEQLHCIGEKSWKITASIGVAVAVDSDFGTFYKNADDALYQSKKGGRNRYTIYKE